jgi:serine O-acetyltransferase
VFGARTSEWSAVITTKDDLAFYVAQDMLANGEQRWRPRFRATKRILYFQWLLRRSEYWEANRRTPVGRLMYPLLKARTRMLGERLGYSIPRGVFGPGLSIAHVGTIVVSPGARVGRGCRIHQGVTIGQLDGNYPTIGDGVWIAPGAQIFGGVKVGDNAAIAANAVVNRDVPPDVTVGGIPARVIRESGADSVHPPRVTTSLGEEEAVVQEN